MLLPWELNKAISQSTTNMSSGEIVDFVLFSRNLSDKDRITIDVENTANINYSIRDITLNGPVARENLSVVVLNGTGVEGSAQKISNIVQNIGARIALVDNADNDYEKSYFITDDAASPTAAYVKAYFPNVNIVDTKTALSFGEDLLDRGDVTFIVGFDILSGM